MGVAMHMNGLHGMGGNGLGMGGMGSNLGGNGLGMGVPGMGIPSHVPSAAGMSIPVNTGDAVVPMTVSKVNVTTPSTADASQKRRKQPANFACPVPGCGSTFTRHFNLKGKQRFAWHLLLTIVADDVFA